MQLFNLFCYIFVIKVDDVLMFVTAAGSTESTSDETVRGDRQEAGMNPLLMTGGGLCVLVLLCSVAFVCYRQLKSRQIARKLSLTSTPVHEALLSGAEQADKSRLRTRQQSSTAANDSNDHSQEQVSYYCL